MFYFSHFYKLLCVLDFVIYKIYCKKKKKKHTHRVLSAVL